MTKKRKKDKSKEHLVVLAELKQVRDLRREITILKRLPKDFRDCPVGGVDWEAFADATGRRKEMDKWSNGLVAVFEKLNDLEIRFFGKERLWYFDPDQWTKQTWFTFLGTCEEAEVSWIYLPEEEEYFINALNAILSRFGYNMRAKGQLLSEHTGKPLGVVY